LEAVFPIGSIFFLSRRVTKGAALAEHCIFRVEEYSPKTGQTSVMPLRVNEKVWDLPDKPNTAFPCPIQVGSTLQLDLNP